MLGMSMSGVPYIHADAGGFAGGDGDNELYVRWMQFAAFTPIFRPHGTALYDIDPKAYSFPSEAALIDTPYREYAKQAIRKRYNYLPYNYTLAYKQSKEGAPLVSPLYYYFSNDSTSVFIEDEYMWGDELLVAPVLMKGTTIRQVYLPKGKWYDMTDNRILEGPGYLPFDAHAYRFPLFAKAGSFIPQFIGEAANTKEMEKHDMTVLYVPSSTASQYRLYKDDGETKDAIASNEYELIDFYSMGKTAEGLNIAIKSNGGNYKNKPDQTSMQLVIPDTKIKPSAIRIDGVEMNIVTNTTNDKKNAIWNQETSMLMIPLQMKKQVLQVEVKW
jgi:oligosaccharide 4-alpha-D-glucosyltransferase